MKAEERKRREENELAHGVTALMERAKSGRLVNYRWLGLVVAAALVIGVWWYASFKSRQADSTVWSGLADLFRSGRTNGLTDFANTPEHQKTVAGRLARVELARNQLGPEGIARLQIRNKDERNKGIENIEKAREEFVKLADEFQSDPTMRATCLMSAAEAELALVGIPKAGGSGDMGTPGAAAEFYRKAAQAIGENTPVGEQATKKSEELEAKKDEIARVADRLNTLVAPATAVTIPTPGAPNPEAPKAPEGPIGGQKQPEGAKPEGPKAPNKPLSPPPDAAAGLAGGVVSGTTPPPSPAPAPPPVDPNKK
jgi:hypothetical protein